MQAQEETISELQDALEKAQTEQASYRERVQDMTQRMQELDSLVSQTQKELRNTQVCQSKHHRKAITAHCCRN